MLSLETWLPLVTFIILMVGTPGPANLLMMSGGASLGFWRCMPFNAGLLLGKVGLGLAFGLGLGALLQANETLALVFKFISGGYMLYLVAVTWNAATTPQAQAKALTFPKGLLVHPMSPKTWAMQGIAWTSYAPDFGPLSVQIPVIILSFLVFQTVAHSGWCALGALMGKALNGNIWLSRGLALLTAAVVIWALFY